jgi:hypothetical protein
MSKDLSQATVNPNQVKPSSAVSRWSLDNQDVDSGTIKDTWGSNNGTINNGGDSTMTGATGIGHTGEAFQFDGNNDYVDTGGNPFSTAGSFTVSCWAYSNGPISAGNGWRPILGTESSDHGFQIGRSYEGASGTGGHEAYFLNVINNGSSNFIYQDKQPIHEKWLHFAGLFDGNSIRLYINGVEVAFTPAPDRTLGKDLLIGSVHTNSFNWNGKIDEVRIYSEALTQQQIWKLYNIGRNANWGLSRS